MLLSDDAPNITLEQVARAAGVSPSTVSRILNGSARVSEAKRQAVESVIERYGYQPNVLAQALARGTTMSIGVLVQSISSPFYGESLKGVEDALANTGFIPLFTSGNWNAKEEARCLSLLQARRVDGVIVHHGRLSDEHLVGFARRTPMVVIGRQLSAPNLASMSTDNFQGAYDATCHLIELGHKRIVHIAGPEDHVDAAERARGYRQAITDAGLNYDENLLARADFLEQSGMLAINQLLESRQDFTAVFAANDQSAYGARLALYRRNLRVPEDISLVGFDDLVSSVYTLPPLTSVRQPAYEFGQVAAATMLNLIEGKPVVHTKFPLHLVVRESTRRLRR